jgi:hypothetical protein
MLTIEQLQAMPASERAAYLGQTDRQARYNERTADQARNEERKAKAEADWHEARAREARAYFVTLEAAGLWPVAAPATTALRGELLMSGQTEAIDALDRLAKGGER